MERRCKYCRVSIEGKHANAKFCSPSCKKQYWAKYIEPRAVCKDCGTLLGINSARNVRGRKESGYCNSCSVRRRRRSNQNI